MIFSKKRLFLVFLIIAIVFVAFGQTLLMYFWQDDSALIFKLQNIEGPAGSFGKGLWERGAYQYLIVPFVPFFQIFQLNPFGYFLIGLLTYLGATLAFYIFCGQLFFKSKLIGSYSSEKITYFSTLFFAAGYISSNTMFRIANSWQTNIGIILALLAFSAYLKYLRSRKLVEYILALILFFATIELVYIRSHSIILPILAMDILFTLIPFRFMELFKLILRQVPFWILFKIWYLQSAGFGGPGIKNIFEQVVLSGRVENIAPLFADIGNILVPDVIQKRLADFSIYLISKVFGGIKGDIGVEVLIMNLLILLFFGAATLLIYKYQKKNSKITLLAIFAQVTGFLLNIYFYNKNPIWYRSLESTISGLIGLEFSILIFYIGIIVWKKYRELGIGLIFGWILIISQIFGYFSQYPTAIFNTTHRYFSHSFIGYCLVLGILTYLLYLWISKNFKINKLLGYSGISIIVFTNLVLGVNYQNKFVNEISNPSRKYWSDLKALVPTAEKNSIFYFDIINDNFYRQQFDNFYSVGSMPESTALAIYYNLDRYDISIYTDFNEMLSKLASDSTLIDKTYTFFYDQNGLVDTTLDFRDLIKNGSRSLDIVQDKLDGSLITQKNDLTEITNTSQNIENLNFSSLTPVLYSFKASINVPDTPTKFPVQSFRYLSNISFEERELILEYLKSREEYYMNVSVSSLSEWKFREVRNLVDKDPEATYQGHRIYWHENNHEQLIIDLGSVKEVNRIVWINWNNTLAPTSYSFEGSLDNNNWQMLKKVDKGLERKSGEIVTEDFQSSVIRYIRMDISQTLTDDSPAIGEIEVVESKYDKVDPAKALLVMDNLFGRVSSIDEWNSFYDLSDGLIQMEIARDTNKNDIKYTSQRIFLHRGDDEYFVVLPAGGTRMNKIEMMLNIPVSLKIYDIKLSNLSLDELKQWGQIIEFSEN